MNKETGDLVIFYAVPIYHNNDIIGVFCAKKDGSDLSHIASGIVYKRTGYAYIINNSGVTVGHKDKEWVIKQDNNIENMKTNSSLKELGELTQKIIAGNTRSGVYTYKGVTKYVGYSPIENSPWIIIFGIEKSEALTAVDNVRNTLLIIAAISIVLGAVVTYFVSNGISKPIKKVTEQIFLH